MQSLFAQRLAVLDSHSGQHSNCPKDGGATRQLWSSPKPARQRSTFSPLQPCNAFLPWQRAQQPAPPSFPGQDGMQLTEEATPQQQLGYGDGQAVASLINLSEESLRSPVTAVLAEPTFPRGPIIGGSGGGIFFFWQLGVMKYLSQVYDLSQVQFRGASAGALVSTLAACGVTPDVALATAYELALEYQVFERPLGLVGVWGGLVRTWLDALLPADAHMQCSGRVKLVVTQLPSLRQEYVEEFATKADLIDACMASAHIPFFLDGKPAAWHRGRWYVDGSLQDFVLWKNSELLTCRGAAFIVDYSMDEDLKFDRMDFVKLRGLDEVRELMNLGFKYAERQEAAGVLEAHFGDFRRAQWPGWKPSQVPSDADSFLHFLGPSLAALRPRLESLSNVLPWVRRQGDDDTEEMVAEEAEASKVVAAIVDWRGIKLF